MERQIACLYIPSFEIALARAQNAALRNRPVAVAPVHTSRALIREVSPEASAEGLQPGMSVELARLMCPARRIVPPDSSRVEAAHRELEQRVFSCAPAWESIRPGSLFLDFTGTTRLFGPPIDTATRIGRELTRHQGWESVIGLAGSKLVSQLAAATMKRPPQVLWIHPGSEPPFLAPLPIMLLPGLSRSSTSLIIQRLEDLNLRTLGAIASVSLAHLETVFGTSATLRQQQRVCRRLRLFLRHSDHVERMAHERLPHGTCWETDLQPVLTRLFYRCLRRRVRVTRLTLQIDRLESPAEQLSLYDEAASVPSASHRLSTALDAIRAKFGEHALCWGNTLR